MNKLEKEKLIEQIKKEKVAQIMYKNYIKEYENDFKRSEMRVWDINLKLEKKENE